MKRTIIITVLAFAAALAGTSCDEAKETLENKMTAKIDGEEWKSLFRATVIRDSAIVITATNKASKTEGQQLVVWISGKAEGQYTLSAESASGECGAIYKPDAEVEEEAQHYASVSGTVNLNKMDKENTKISGTFEFTMIKGINENKIEITDGKFNDLNYTDVTN